jgi:orotate phosphoribosyltransferase
MQLLPSQEDVVALLRKTGGLRDGHFEYPNGLHATEYLQVALTMRDYAAAKILSVGLSRKLRAHSDIRAVIPELSVVAPATGGLPVAYGVCEALRARQVYWSERENANEPMRFRQYLDVQPGEKVLLVDDILRSGQKLSEATGGIAGRGSRGGGSDRVPAESGKPPVRPAAVLLFGPARWHVLPRLRFLRAVQARRAARKSLGLGEGR